MVEFRAGSSRLLQSFLSNFVKSLKKAGRVSVSPFDLGEGSSRLVEARQLLVRATARLVAGESLATSELRESWLRLVEGWCHSGSDPPKLWAGIGGVNDSLDRMTSQSPAPKDQTLVKMGVLVNICISSREVELDVHAESRAA